MGRQIIVLITLMQKCNHNKINLLFFVAIHSINRFQVALKHE